MKKQVQQFAKSHGIKSFYSGWRKTMFFEKRGTIDMEQMVLDKFGYSLPFKLATNARGRQFIFSRDMQNS